MLRTNQNTQSRPGSSHKQSPEISNFGSSPQKKRPNHILVPEKNPLQTSDVVQSACQIQLKSSTDIENHYYKERRPQEVNGNEDLRSETNLLESSPSRTPEQSPRLPKKALSVSRCLEMRVESERFQSSEASGIMEVGFGQHL